MIKHFMLANLCLKLLQNFLIYILFYEAIIINFFTQKSLKDGNLVAKKFCNTLCCWDSLDD